jgi:hypothetical protein
MQLMGGAEALRSLGVRDEIIKDVLTDNQTVTKAEYEATKQWKSDSMSNPEFVKLYLGGDNEARRKMTLANIILTGGLREMQHEMVFIRGRFGKSQDQRGDRGDGVHLRTAVRALEAGPGLDGSGAGLCTSATSCGLHASRAACGRCSMADHYVAFAGAELPE